MRKLFYALLAVVVIGSAFGCSSSSPSSTSSSSQAAATTEAPKQVAEVKTPVSAEPVSKTEVAIPTPTSTVVVTPTAVPTNTPVPATATPAAPTATKVPPTATPVPVTPTPAMSDRDALKTFVNNFWPHWDKYDEAIARFNASVRQARQKNDLVGAIDRLVKDTEAILPGIRALSPPNVPFAKAFHAKFVEGMEKEYEAMKRLNWGLVTDQPKVVDQAFDDLEESNKAQEQSIWELKAAVEKQGLRYNSQKRQWE